MNEDFNQNLTGSNDGSTNINNNVEAADNNITATDNNVATTAAADNGGTYRYSYTSDNVENSTNVNQGGAYQNSTYSDPYQYANNMYTPESEVNQAELLKAQKKAEKKARKEEKKLKRKNSKFLKGTKFVAAAAFFGVLAGSVTFGTNYFLQENTADNSSSSSSSESSSTASMSVSTVNTNYESVGVTVMDVSDIVKSAMPSIVAINGTVTTSGSYYEIPGLGSFGTESAESAVSGSGIIIGQSDTELLIVSNAHVVDDVNNLSVTFSDDSTADAYIKGSKASRDIAVIAVKLSDLSEDTLSQIKIATIGDSDSVEVGEAAIAIGNALGYGQSVTAGCISALDRSITIDDVTYDGLIQTDAAINPGNSGGALLDASGNLIGINSAKASSDSVEGMGYAIPISSVMDLINELMNKETRTVVDEAERGYLGIYGATVTSDISSMYGYPEGVYIRETIEGAGADEAGLYKGDIIYEVDGEEIGDMTELQELLEYYKAGETVSVSIYRLSEGGYVEETVEVTLQKSTEISTDDDSDSNVDEDENEDESEGGSRRTK